MKSSQIKSKGSKSKKKSSSRRSDDESDADDAGYERGDRVEAKVSGWTKYYAGEITRVNRDGTYDIKFDDGERKSGVKSSQIKSKGSKSKKKSSSRRSDDESDADDAGYERGDRVEAKVSGWTKYYAGEITRVNRDGTYDIKFDDGERKSGVKSSQIKSKGSKSKKKSSSRRSDDESDADDAGYERGDRVEAKVSGWTKYYAGEITRVNRDGTYDIKFDDGERKSGVKSSQIKSKGSKSKKKSSSRRSDDESDADDAGYERGDRVEAKVSGWTKYYGGEITRVNRDGTYDIKFDDGERKSGVKSSQIKSKGSKSKKKSSSRRSDDESDADDAGYERGDRVEAKVSGWTKYYAGEITRVNRDGTYDIKFDDGERKSGVKSSQIKSKGSKSKKKSSSRRSDDESDADDAGYERGDRVEAKVSGWTKYYGGEITRVNRDGTYDIKFDDGERKSGVKSSQIKSKGSKSKKKSSSRRSDDESDADDAGYERGDRVEAKVSGWTKYYAGEITRVNRDGTYDIKFDDGERKSGVKSSQIKSKGSKSKKKSSSRRSDDESDADDAGYERGDRVEAKVSGWTKYYAGEITRVNRDGTYDIKFDDGERKSGVKSSQIKSKGSKSKKKSSSRRSDDESDADDAGYERGDRVEAKVSGWTKYYAGEITRVNRDGTYDIKFDDGERKSGVKSSQIKSKGSKSKKKSSSRRSDDESDADDAGYERGDRVEAKVSGWTKYYAGEITRVNRDGTYDIKFDDGERKSGVKSSQIKSKGSKSKKKSSSRRSDDESDADDAGYERGDRVEAKVSGWTKYYAGEITRVNRDGTYDIKFDDGERKSGVKSSQIKSKASKRSSRRNNDGRPGGDLRKGMQVQARFMEGKKWFPGNITKVNRDGTYDIAYNDGTDESRVPRSLIKVSMSPKNKKLARSRSRDKYDID